MSQQDKLIGTPTPTLTQLPVKRKRGRPRKDENLAKREHLEVPVTPVPDGLHKTQEAQHNQGNDVDESMVGQVITGVIQGTFDAGYIISVKIGNNSNAMRGVVFKPEKITPVTAANDIAPNVKMYKLHDIPIPAANPPSHANGSFSQSKHEHPDQQENKVPATPNQMLTPVLQSNAPFALTNPSSSVDFPLNDVVKNVAVASLAGKSATEPNSGLKYVNESSSSITVPLDMSKTDGGISMGGMKVVQQQISDFKFENQSASSILPLPNIPNSASLDIEKVALQPNPQFGFENQSPPLLKNLKMVEQDEVMQVFEVPASEPVASIFPGNKTSSQLPSVQNQVSESEVELHQTSSGGESQFLLSEPQTDSEPCPTETLHNGLANSNIELHQTTIVTESQPVPTESEYVDTGLKSSEPAQDKISDSNLKLNETTRVAEPHSETPDPKVELMDIVKEATVPPMNTASHCEQLEPTEKDSNKYDLPYNGEAMTNVTDNTEAGSQHTLRTEAALPVKPVEESFFPGKFDSHVASSPVRSNDMEFTLVEAIPPAQSQC